MRITLAGLAYTAHSPSLFSMETAHGRVSIGFDGELWRIAVRDAYGDIGWPTREEAAQLVADCIEGVNAPVALL